MQSYSSGDDKEENSSGKLMDSKVFNTRKHVDNVHRKNGSESCRNNVPHHSAKPIGQKKKEMTRKEIKKMKKLEKKRNEREKKKNIALEKRRKKALAASEKRILHIMKQQLMFPEARVQLPRREPPQMSLAEFLEHRRKTGLPIPPVIKPTRAQLIKWLDSLDDPEAAGTSQAQSVPNPEVDKKTSVPTIKEQIRKVKEDALRSGFVPKLTSDTKTHVYLDRVYNRGAGGLSKEAREFKERMEGKMDKPVRLLKLKDNPSALVFDNDKGPKLLQLQKYLQVGIFKNRDERHAKKTVEYNLQKEKRLKKEAEEKLAEECLDKKELNYGTEDINSFMNGETDDAESNVKLICEEDEYVQGGAWNEFDGEDQLLMLCSGNFPQSQNDGNNVDPASGLDDNVSTTNASGPIGPQVANIHRKILLEDDEKNLTLVKEKVLRYSDFARVTELPRKFQWKNIANDLVETLPQSEQIDEDSDDYDDGHWRIEMREREKWLKEQEHLEKMEKNPTKRVNPDTKDTIVPRSGTSYLSKSPQNLSTVGLRGGYLHRGKDELGSIAKMTEKGFQNSRLMNSRKFFFAPLPPKIYQKKFPVKLTSDVILNS